ncbi:MAG: hypothetical protein COY39_00590 [Alphaproteobacteria bacterium CG_4_10_14_0_8_um_filter_37_21]|nr:MAG: hypothetical protein COY39_00590 [Alphaproteobacteria bacterium CG_4_10_14_0_8_um_filter_37_21]
MLYSQQHIASDPKISAYVSASAGTGKTKILVDRLIRLLLNGTPPESILCLTFTKAAANEMLDRLLKALESIIHLEKDALICFFKELGEEHTVEKEHLAKTLFFTILDLEGGLKIQTLHAFCQRIVEAYAWELERTPPMNILDEIDQREIIQKSINTVTSSAPENQGLIQLINIMGYSHFITLINSNIGLSLTELQKSCIPFALNNPFSMQELSSLIKSLPQNIQDLLPISAKNLMNFFLTKTGTPRKTIIKKSILKEYLGASEILSEIADLFVIANDMIKVDRLNTLNKAFFSLTHAVKEHYQDAKKKTSSLDFNDLIDLTSQLLNKEGSGSLESKLGYSLKAILVDEAQDTSPQQWDILDTLIQSMVLADSTGSSSLFIVGDLKQAIYSFQGSKPEIFLSKPEHFKHLFKEFRKPFKVLKLEKSYRSSVKILNTVDKIFNTNPNGLFITEELTHIPNRQFVPGKVALAKLDDKKINGTEYEWKLPHLRDSEASKNEALAQKIAACILSILDRTDSLASTNAPPQPQDIMILVRNRGSFVEKLNHVFLSKNIPISGLDRFKLTEHLMAQDFLCLGAWACSKTDDYSLTCLLKSPFYGTHGEGIDEILLHEICTTKNKETLWKHIQNISKTYCDTHPLAVFVKLLNLALKQLDYRLITEFFSTIWQKTSIGFLQQFGPEASDIFEEFYSQAYSLEQSKSMTMQAFVWHMHGIDLYIKKDVTSKTYPEIRIMTIHGSKGLQSPIVIMADANIRTTLAKENTLFYKNRHTLKPAESQCPSFLKDNKGQTLDAFVQEERRLLYVAMTRAEDELYIFGKGDKIIEESWYDILNIEKEAGNIDEYTLPVHVKKVFSQSNNKNLKISVPPYFYTDVNKKTLVQPDYVANKQAAERGIIIHKLFEVLPTIPPEKQLQVTNQILGTFQNSALITVFDTQNIIDIIHNSEYEIFFKTKGVNELSLTYEGNLYRLDRFVEKDGNAYILDFKTGTRSLQKLNTYKKQIQIYSAAIDNLYSPKKVYKYVLWTDEWQLDIF